MVKILLVQNDGEHSVAESLIGCQNYLTETLSFGKAVHERLKSGKFDMIIFDVKHDGANVFALCNKFRESGGTSSILVVADENGFRTKEAAINAGADDCLFKPFDIRELDARMRALLRRPRARVSNQPSRLYCAHLEVDVAGGRVIKNGEEIHLHPMEFNLLEFLLRHQGQVFSAKALWVRVWGDRDGLMGTVRTHIKTLRNKIDIDNNKSLIITVRGRGYTIDQPLERV